MNFSSVNDTPRVVVAAGVSRSGSTWAYNAILELLGIDNCVGVFSTEFSEDVLVKLAPSTTLVLKTHTPSPGVKAAALALGFPIILTVRDPRDCVASFIKQFGWTFEAALTEVSKNFAALHELAASPQVIIIKYESGEERVATIKRIAKALNKDVDDRFLKSIAHKLSPAEIKKNISVLFPEKADVEKPSEVWDPVTHWHPKHVGNGKVGKYKTSLTARQIAMVDRATEMHSHVFGYRPDSLPPLQSGDVLEVGTPFLPYPSYGFSLPEGWGTWISEEVAGITIPLSHAAKSLKVDLDIVVSYNFFGYVPEALAKLSVNDQNIFTLTGNVRTPENIKVIAVLDGKKCDEVRLDFRFSGLKSPIELQIGNDDRTLGLALSKVKIDYS